MAGTTYKKRDRNRFRKVYQYLRKKPRNTYFFDKPTTLEAFYIDFSQPVTTGTYVFTEKFDSVPYVTATAGSGDTVNNQDDVNVFITSVTKFEVTIEVSAPFDGRVYFQAMYIEC